MKGSSSISKWPRRHAVLACVLIWSVALSPAWAWNAKGHRVIASLAFRQLSAAQQSKIAALLERHPRFTEDFADPMPDDVRGADSASRREWSFQQAAVWPDLVRSGPPEKRAFNRGEWHYVNVPHFLSDAARHELDGKLLINLATDVPPEATLETAPLNIVQTIRFARQIVADQQTSPADRAVMLAWLFHTVGDIHQPLHSTALFSARLFPAGDRGGNSVKTLQSGNLHALWDQFPGQSDSFREARNQALEKTVDSRLAAIGTEAATTLDEQLWLKESHALAQSRVYTEEVLSALRNMESAGNRESAGNTVQPIDLSQEYLQAGGQVAEQRIVQAGYRLGALLKSIAGE